MRKFSKSRKNFKVLAFAAVDSTVWNRFAVQRLVLVAADIGNGAFITTACRSATMVMWIEMQFANAGCLHQLVTLCKVRSE